MSTRRMVEWDWTKRRTGWRLRRYGETVAVVLPHFASWKVVYRKDGLEQMGGVYQDPEDAKSAAKRLVKLAANAR